MKRIFRVGNIGALMDEYERATIELKNLVETISEAEFTEILDCETSDESCRSVQTIMEHVVNAGYGYADYFRTSFSIDSDRPPATLFSKSESAARLDAMLEYTVRTFERRWIISDDEIDATAIKTRWGVTYDVEQLFEHAIVHVLRHRRQIERLLASAIQI